MKELIDNIQKSIYDPKYYQSVLAEPMRGSFKYFVSLALLLTVFLTIISSISLVVNANDLAHNFPPQFFAYFPDELQVTVTNGVASANVPEPYLLTIPDKWKSAITNGDNVQNIAVIDTITPFSMDQFIAYKSAFWLGRDQIAYRGDNGAVKIQQFGKGMNFVINEAIMRDFEQKIAPYYRFIGPIIVILVFVVLSIGLAFNIVYLLFGALLIMGLGYVMNRRLSFTEAYRVGLHALTLPLLIDVLIAMSSLSFMRIPFIPTLIMLVVVYVNFKDASPSVTKTESVSMPAPQP
ncbi:MAG: hypothetical protein A2Z88_08730 [Omnitrophica WOR_2 bacterium GWA2_47_8]|nr:MAG: hypothetical protein A2Z88_08730 [Omnitrophica WOR_2 bacterium GWA2_47_8]